MKAGTAYIYVLTALGGGASHGLGIAENVAHFTQGRILLGPGTLYRCLSDLSRQGLITRTEVAEESESPHRKYYRITDAGRLRLTEDVGGLDQLVRTARRRLKNLRPTEAT